ncbi:MAG: YchJ family protein [Bacteroidales bacterium]|nr:YchJ family protein [Bacteroidales bacterium]
MSDCPCCSGKSYSECCEAIIKNESAPTALSLMRSRYTAYKNEDAEYLYKTTHPKTRGEYEHNEIKEWSKENTWIKLKIISLEHGNVNDTKGIVEFKAYYQDKHRNEQMLHERSTFLKENKQWFYLDGINNPPRINLMKKVLRNDPCPCGSGKKQKNCCGKSN